MTPYENHMTGFRAALKLAEEYRLEAAETTDQHRREICLWEAEHADEKARWYLFHASLCVHNPNHRKAA